MQEETPSVGYFTHRILHTAQTEFTQPQLNFEHLVPFKPDTKLQTHITNIFLKNYILDMNLRECNITNSLTLLDIISFPELFYEL